MAHENISLIVATMQITLYGDFFLSFLRETLDQIANICWIIEKAREFLKICFCFPDYTKAFDFVDHNKLENS